MLFGKVLKPEEVFTPRAPEVNSGMYIERPSLEKALSNALRGHMHIVIHGESGSGKSWLYKKQFASSNTPFIAANLANASRLGSISAELRNIVDRKGGVRKSGYEEDKSAGLDAVVAKAGVSHKDKYEVGRMEPFEECLAVLNREASDMPSVLVFDNLESIFSSKELLKELADLVILCDDERYAAYKVKIMIVGVPGGVKEYYYRTPNQGTVANRLYELPEVSRLSVEECGTLVARGFLSRLKYSVFDIDAFTKHVSWVTNRIPQMVHEYCLEAAYIGESNRAILASQISEADAKWISKSLYHAYSVAEDHMNERDTKAGRRNQTLFALSLCEGDQFKASEVDAIIRREFPTSTAGTALNVAQTLSQLGYGARKIVKRSPKGDAFTFADPRYRMVLRSMLRKTPDERVEKIAVSSS